jgi:hypothetical protein
LAAVAALLHEAEFELYVAESALCLAERPPTVDDISKVVAMMAGVAGCRSFVVEREALPVSADMYTPALSMGPAWPI